jgi:Protein of unknown function (DUF295)/F-box domain
LFWFGLLTFAFIIIFIFVYFHLSIEGTLNEFYVCCFQENKKPMAEWSDLPIDVLEHLTSFLPLPDYHRFSAVCRNWQIATKQRRYSPAEQLPWLLVRGESDPHKRRVFSISENRHYNIGFPELEGQYVCGSSYGWLFTVDKDLKLRLLNPLVGKCYYLPVLPFTNIIMSYIGIRVGGRDGYTYTCEDVQVHLVYKAILDHDPGQRLDFTVVILSAMGSRMVYFWRPGNLVWTIVDCDSNFDDITYFKGKFYAIDFITIGEVDINITHVINVGLDPKAIRLAPEIPMCDEFDFCKRYLVDFRGELLLLQMWNPYHKDGHRITRTILVFKVDLEGGKYYQRHHLDGYSLFLGTSSPLVVDPRQFPGCSENCIYFAADYNCNGKKYSRDDNGIYDMVKGTVSPYYPPEIYHPQIVGPIWWTPQPW